MKKYFPHISALFLTFVLVFVMSGLIFPQTVHADYCSTGPNRGIRWENKDCLKFGGALLPGDPPVGTTAAAAPPNAFGAVVDAGINFLLAPLGWLAILILQIASLFTYLGGVLLNFVVKFTVVEMAQHLKDIGTIDTAWKTIRDIANIGFIFILLYAAIRTILGIGSDTKKLIVNIVVVAILINFSLFFTKVVIDASNVLAITFYDAIAPDALTSNTSLGLSGSLMEPLQLTSLWKADQIGLNGKRMIIVGVMGTIVVLIAAFVFFAVAIMFVIRFVVLIFVLILSPLAFMGFILPQLKQYKDQWQEALLGQAFFAPIYFMLTWIVIIVSRGLLKSTESSRAGSDIAKVFIGAAGTDGNFVNTPPPSAIAILVNFIIMIVFLIASLIIAKKWADKAGHGVPGLTKWATGFAGGATLGMAGRFGRGTIGRAGESLAQNQWLKDKAPTSMAARLALATGRKTSGASFDVRGTPLGGTLQTGQAQKGGFAADLKSKVEAQKKYADEVFKPSELQVIQAEKALSEAKKTGTTDDIKTAQAELDRISGASEDVIRQRKLKEFRARGDSKKQAKQKLDDLEDQFLKEVNKLTVAGMTQEAAEEDARKRDIGWSPKAIEGLTNVRKGAYAKTVEERELNIPFTDKKVPYGFTTRHGIFGPVKKESKLAANAIRKSMKEKKAGEKIAEEIEKQARESSEGTETTPTTTPPPTPPSAGGITPSP